MHAQDLYERLAAGYDYDPMYGELCTERDRLKKENVKLRDFIELLLSCPRDSGECEECMRLNDLCVVELEAGKLGIEVE